MDIANKTNLNSEELKEEQKAEYEGDEKMSGLAIACSSPFISNRKELKRTPMSQGTKERREFMRNHNFSINVDEKTMKIEVVAKEK